VHSLCEERRLEKAALFQRFAPDAITILYQLRERGFKLAIVSNFLRATWWVFGEGGAELLAKLLSGADDHDS
jgi:phosphoglycolate phosphatase-like HAD superfamily hydrolase